MQNVTCSITKKQSFAKGKLYVNRSMLSKTVTSTCKFHALCYNKILVWSLWTVLLIG